MSTKDEAMTVSPNGQQTDVTCRLLSVGDVIYMENNYGFSGKIVIERVTKTQAISGNVKLRIETLDNGKRAKAIGETYGWNSTRYLLETPEVKERYWRQGAVRKLKEADYSKLSTEVLQKLLSLVNGR